MDKNFHTSWPAGWETTRKIGNGSFGTVYEIHRNLFGDVEKAALKVISIPRNASDIDEMYSDGYDDKSISNTFHCRMKSIVAEYSLMRKMNGSANIVSCDDVHYEQHSDGIGWDIYIKMELLMPLTEALPKVISDEQVIKIAKDLCTALTLCGKYNIVHRDIKPQNIFVSENGDYKLGDFGIAKTIEKTMGGTKTGTYKYMAPEVYNDKPYNNTVDIYSLGLVLYWMLNERRVPFLPMPPATPDHDEVEWAKQRRFAGEKIPAPKHGSKELKRIVLKACAYDPKERYQTAGEMWDDLLHITENQGWGETDGYDSGQDNEGTSGFDFDTDDEGTTGLDFDKDDEETKGVKFGQGLGGEKPPKKKIWPVVVAIVSTLVVIGAVLSWLLHDKQIIHQHSWKAATCTTLKTCETCGETTGVLADHQWKAATCTTPRTCKNCGKTIGSVANHKWKAATYDAPKTCSICGQTEGTAKKKPQVGDIIKFGTYEQDGNENNGKEPIEWQILKVEDDQALIISRYGLDCKKYHREYGGTNWKDCSLRSWLNIDFLQEAFTENEQKSIIMTIVDNSASQGNDNKKWKKKNGDQTDDMIFLLSYKEAETYFSSDESRICRPTDYVIKYDDSKQGVISSYTGTGWWWLRSPGVDGRQAAIVNHKGELTSQTVANDYISVRPVLWMDLG